MLFSFMGRTECHEEVAMPVSWVILEICLSSFWLCMCYAYGDLGEILIFRHSETTSSAFSGMMNSIWEKLYYAYSQNNIQHILTCKSIMNPYWCWYSVSRVYAIEKRHSYLLISIRIKS